jgi:hypothetical protein
MGSSKFNSRLTSIIGYIHLVYLGLLPSLATFGLLYVYGHPAPLLLLVGGTAAVGVYLAATFYYTPLPTSLGWSLLVLLDGPAWALVSIYSKRVSPLGFAVGGLLVDGTAIWLSILILALGSSRPVREQRTASAGFMLLALATTATLVWPYFRDVLWGQWVSLGWLGLGIFETLIVRFNQLERDEAARNANYSPVYIVALILIWVGSMIAGNVLHELALKATP